jgi:hypothetical protein
MASTSCRSFMRKGFMQLVTVTALKAVVDGRDVCLGEAVEMHPVRAAIAARRGEVSLTKRAYQTRHMEAAPITEPDPPKRRRRRRRKTTEDAA